MNINKFIDHTVLKADATDDNIDLLLDEAKNNDFKAVCVNPCHVERASRHLKDSGVLVATVIGFPLGANTVKSKVYETVDAIKNGADEIDMVINIGKLKSGNYDYVEDEIRQIKKACGDVTLKVIIETCLLSEEEKKIACRLSKNAKADFVKTSTGFSTGGATVEDVRLMKSIVGDELEVKASGGVRDMKSALQMIEAGATRLGTSSGVKIVKSR